MAEDRYRINRGNYTLRKRHQVTKDGYVYERDFMATTSPGSWEGDVFSFSENNFKMVRRVSDENKRKHLYGAWFKENLTLDELGEASDSETINTESAIYLKPNYGDITDFAYYAGLEEKLKTTVQYIVGYFPAELYVTDKNEFEYYDEDKNVRKLGYNLSNDLHEAGVSLSGYTAANLVEVSNPFEINTTYKSTNNAIINNMSHLRFMCNSYSEYKMGGFSSGSTKTNCEWEVLYKTPDCDTDGRLTGVVYMGKIDGDDFYLFEYYLDGEYILLTDKRFYGKSIRPYQDGKDNDFYLNDFINNLDDFGKLLLNRDSKPLYTCTIYNPVEISNGVGRYKKSFTWPTLYGYNLDVITPIYNNYIDSLLKIAIFYDEGYTNNMWNRMTHDSIKNMDLTLTMQNSTDDNEDYVIGGSRIEAYIQIIANFFDNLKRHCDNIQYVNRVTYDEYNNLPDYFLSDSLQLSGWEVSEPTNVLSDVTYTHPDSEEVYTLSSTNCEFMKNLKLSAKDILTKKGTRQGIEETLGMFGLRSYDRAKNFYNNLPENLKTLGEDFDSLDSADRNGLYEYKINEYVYVASGSTTASTETELDVEKYNSMKLNYDPEENSVQGLCCAIKYTDDGKKYLVPYYTYPKELDGNPYFQMYGGWGNAERKEFEGVYRDERENVPFYDETLKYMGVVKDVSDLTQLTLSKIYNGCIYYVIEKGEIYSADTCSNYFTLVGSPEEYSETFYTDEYPHGWRNIPQEQIDGIKEQDYDLWDATLRVAYLESLIDESSGNNPHVGYGRYDEGEGFLEYYKQLFKYSIENDNFADDAYTCETGELDESIEGIGFSISKLKEDNVKCWYFTDNENTLNITSGDTWESDTNPNVGGSAEGRFLESTEDTYDFFNGNRKKITEASSYSLINSKVIDITFEGKYCDTEWFQEYFYSTINKYLKQVIPSTAIYRVKFRS